MKICLIVDDYMPHSIKVAAKMMHELAQEYVKQGHSVSVLTPNPHQKENCKTSKLDGVNIISFKSGEIKNVSKIKRAINETMLSFNAWKNSKEILKNDKYDLIVYYSPSIFFGPLVKKLKKLWDAKTYLVLRDIFPQWTIDNKILKEKSLITYYFKFFEKINYEAADTIGVMSEKNLEWFKDYYKTNKSLEVLYNWADLKEFKQESNKYRKMLNLEDKIIYFYGGNLGHAQDMMNLVRLAVSMQDENKVHFLFVGAGDEYNLIENSIKEKELKNITLLPSVDQEEFKQLLAECDVGLFSLNKNHKTHNFPGKLLGYMVQSMPILGSINSNNDLQNIIEDNNAGFISVNEEDDILVSNAKKLLDKKIRKQIGKNANNLLKNKFSVNSAAMQILDSHHKGITTEDNDDLHFLDDIEEFSIYKV